MGVEEKVQSDQVQQLIYTREQNSTLELFAEETDNSVTKVDSEEVIMQSTYMG